MQKKVVFESAYDDSVIFRRMFNHDFSNANFGYLEDFFGSMLISKFALNVLKKKNSF